MDVPDSPVIKKAKNNRKPLFIIGLVFGLLLGSLLTMLVVDWLHYHYPKRVQVHNVTPETDAKADTIVKLVIHKYDQMNGHNRPTWENDTLSADSLYAEDESEDLMLDEEEQEEFEEMDERVQEEQLLWQKNIKVIYLNNSKEVMESSDGALAALSVQAWDTPIKNKMSYLFSGKTLKIKGMQKDQFKVYHFKNTFYLVINHRVYPLRHNKQYERLEETQSIDF